MLLIGRKLGQRARIETPGGQFIWVTMGDGRVFAYTPDYRIIHTSDGGIKIQINEKITIKACYVPKTIHGTAKTLINQPGMGIAAPRDYTILREELIIENENRI